MNNKSEFKKRGSVNTIPTEPGRKFKDEYEIQIDEYGHKSLIKTGETNLYAKIQAELEETKIENILTRATLGDPEALNRANMMYLDTTDMPKSLAEAQNTIIRIETEFERLPLEQRAKFDHSKEKFISQYGTIEWANALGLIPPAAPIGEPDIKEPGVKKEKKEKVDNE